MNSVPRVVPRLPVQPRKTLTSRIAVPKVADAVDDSSAALHDVSISAAASRVLRRFRFLSNAARANFRELEKPAGISGSQLWALSVVRDRPGIGVGDLAQAMDIHQSTASNLLRPMFKAGWLEAQRAQEDRRLVELRITPAAATLLGAIPGPFSGLLPQALDRLDTAVLQRLERDLLRVTRAIEQERRLHLARTMAAVGLQPGAAGTGASRARAAPPRGPGTG